MDYIFIINVLPVPGEWHGAAARRAVGSELSHLSA